VPTHKFADFKLGGLLVENVAKLGIESPSCFPTAFD
jgi:hypothetical protein